MFMALGVTSSCERESKLECFSASLKKFSTPATAAIETDGDLGLSIWIMKGDAVITLQCAYGAVKNSIKAYFEQAGGYVIEVPFQFSINSNEEIVNEFQMTLVKDKASGRRVRLALIDHVTSMSSVLLPVKKLVEVCREEGVDQVFIDGAHGVGRVDVDMQEIWADFYTNNLYKWFFCPASVAFMYCRKSVTHSELHHHMVSHDYGKGLAIESCWIGTRDYSPLVVPSAVEFTNRFEGGIDGIKRRNHDVVVEKGKMLVKPWGTNLGSPPDMCASMIMVGMPACLGVSSDDDALKLRTHLREKFGAEVPIYYRMPKHEEVAKTTTAYARVSHLVYNKVDDYYKFTDAINQLSHQNRISLSAVPIQSLPLPQPPLQSPPVLNPSTPPLKSHTRSKSSKLSFPYSRNPNGRKLVEAMAKDLRSGLENLIGKWSSGVGTSIQGCEDSRVGYHVTLL
ncbi:hypothetical protein ACLB2K_064611 [Fragaria x ananassa]